MAEKCVKCFSIFPKGDCFSFCSNCGNKRLSLPSLPVIRPVLTENNFSFSAPSASTSVSTQFAERSLSQDLTRKRELESCFYPRKQIKTSKLIELEFAKLNDSDLAIVFANGKVLDQWKIDCRVNDKIRMIKVDENLLLFEAVQRIFPEINIFEMYQERKVPNEKRLISFERIANFDVSISIGRLMQIFQR